jgi:hypothetical protein
VLGPSVIGSPAELAVDPGKRRPTQVRLVRLMAAVPSELFRLAPPGARPVHYRSATVSVTWARISISPGATGV